MHYSAVLMSDLLCCAASSGPRQAVGGAAVCWALYHSDGEGLLVHAGEVRAAGCAGARGIRQATGITLQFVNQTRCKLKQTNTTCVCTSFIPLFYYIDLFYFIIYIYSFFSYSYLLY